MRIILDATTLGSDLGGDETYLAGMLAGLARCAGTDDTFPLIIRRGAQLPEELDSRRFPTRAVRRWPGAVHYTTTLPRRLRAEQGRADLVHTITHAPAPSPIPYALTIGDLSFRHFPEHYPRPARVRLNALVGHQCRGARLVCAPSEFSRHDLIDAFGLDPDRVAVVPNHVRLPSRRDASARAGASRWLCDRGVRAPFGLYLGNLHPRKNVARLVAAHDLAVRRGEVGRDLQLVIAGGKWWKGGAEEAAASRASAGSVVFLGRVDDAVRQVLLEEALLLAYVSIYEGFGVPAIEAMAVGTPVLGSDRAALPEVCGDAAVLVDPFDLDAIATGLASLATDDVLRARLRARGRERAALYDATRTGRAVYDAFARAVHDDALRTKDLAGISGHEPGSTTGGT
jgi:glycosyltransferase involved in cell wall biosynthesis